MPGHCLRMPEELAASGVTVWWLQHLLWLQVHVAGTLFGQGYGFLYEILTRFGPERSRENERIAQAIFRGLRLHQAIRRKPVEPETTLTKSELGCGADHRAKTRDDRQVGDAEVPHGRRQVSATESWTAADTAIGRLGGDGYGDGRPGGGGGDRYGDGGSGGGRYTASRRRQAGRRG